MLAGFRSKDPVGRDAAIGYFTSLDHEAAGEVLAEHQRRLNWLSRLRTLCLAIASGGFIFFFLNFSSPNPIHIGFPYMMLINLVLMNIGIILWQVTPIDWAAVHVRHEETGNRILT